MSINIVMSSKTGISIPTASKYCTEDILVAPDAASVAACVPGNIKVGVGILGQTGTYTADATASAGDILSGKSAYANGSKVTGTLRYYEAQITIPTHISATATLLTMPDNVYAHIDDDSFFVYLNTTDPSQLSSYDEYNITASNNPNSPLQGTYPVYGQGARKTGATGVGHYIMYYPQNPQAATEASAE